DRRARAKGFRQTSGGDRQNVARQGRLLYGRRLHVARQAAQRCASRRSLARTGRAERKDSCRCLAPERAYATTPPPRCTWSIIAPAISSKCRRATASARV